MNFNSNPINLRASQDLELEKEGFLCPLDLQPLTEAVVFPCAHHVNEIGAKILFKEDQVDQRSVSEVPVVLCPVCRSQITWYTQD